MCSETTLLHKKPLKFKYVVWKQMYFHLELIEGILSIPAPTVHLVVCEE